MSPSRMVRAGFLAMVVTVIAVFAAPTPSMAAGDNYLDQCDAAWVSCQTGVRVSGPTGVCATAGADFHFTKVCVDYSGDYVYVLDLYSDGYSAMALIESQRGSTLSRFCRNPNGLNTWARCNFDWREDGVKYVRGGYRDNKYFDLLSEYDFLWSFSGN
jgi:hypothetical protein